MGNGFVVEAIEYREFESLFGLNNLELAKIGAKRMVVDENPGYPCRVSLQDAEIGEEIILLTYKHHDVISPYRASGPIFVRKNALTARLKPNELPKMFYHRNLSLRAYDSNGMMVDAKNVLGNKAEEVIRSICGNALVEYVHVHNSEPGCFNCTIKRTNAKKDVKN